MTRLEFIQELDGLLRSLSDKERLDLLAEYTKHFLNGIEQGKSEQEIAEALGSPQEIARQIIAAREQQRGPSKQQTAYGIRSVLIAIGVILFNLTFVLGPLMGVAGVFFAVFIVSVTLLICPLIFYAQYGMPAEPDHIWFFVSASLAALGLGGMLGVLLGWVTRWTIRLLGRYVQFNLMLIRGN